MKKIIIGLGILVLTGCGLAKVDKEQNENLQVIVQAHNALVAQLDKTVLAVDKALGSNISKRQDMFREAMRPTPTPTALPEHR